MSSPDFSYKSLIQFAYDTSVPVYRQVANQLTSLIERGFLPAGFDLPSSRVLASELKLHRKTIVKVYEELSSQGFIEIIPRKGTFVSKQIPVLKPDALAAAPASPLGHAPYSFAYHKHLRKPFIEKKSGLRIDEGLPDLRLSPIDEIRRSYNSILSRERNFDLLHYASPGGHERLRFNLVDYLKSSRGMTLDPENIIITRGSQMGLYLAAALIVKSGDIVVVGELNYQTANITLQHCGARLSKVSIDKEGMDTMHLEAICKKQKVKAVYVTSHHHHPTTATLSAERRMHLLELANRFNFVILEDDYDYDFHYERSPLLPLASADVNGRVMYVGSISKIIAPGLRVGFLTAPKDVIESATYLRRILDRQGDAVMELVMAQMIASGDYQRHTKKVLKAYLERRDAFMTYLEGISKYVTFTAPLGGLAIWVGFSKKYPLKELSESLLGKGLGIPNWENYDPDKTGHNFIRMGFASLNEEEMKRSFDLLNQVVT